MEFDITTLIHEVKARKPLWQKDNYNRSCRDLVNKLWIEVATKMGVPKELVKTKWKGLRDNFRSELRKLPNKRHHAHRSKWIYFNEMMFIKDQMTTRSAENFVVSGTAENVNVDVDVYTMDDNGGLVIDEVCDANDKSGYNFLNIDNLVTPASTKCNNIQLNISNSSYGFRHDSAQIASSDRVLLRAADINRGEGHGSFNGNTGFTSFQKDRGNPMKRKNVDMEDKHCDINLHNDDDFYFLMSFLPTIKTLPPEKRMFLRFKIQRLIYDEVYNCTKE